jgi:uncharacterized protein (DUF1501 family)
MTRPRHDLPPPRCAPIDRRRLLRHAGRAALGLGIGGAWGALVRGFVAGSARAETPVPRLLLVFLDGGWNSQLSVDPVVADRRASGNFEAVYNSHDVKAPSGKPALLTGIGFQDAFPAFATMPTAFVNGLNVEITAHDAAANYILTGKQVIGRTDSQPALPAVLASSRGGLASHVVFGGSIPLGDTIEKAPPLATSGEGLGDLLTAPGHEFHEETQDAIQNALVQLDEVYYRDLGDRAQASLAPFRTSQGDVAEAFRAFGGKLQLTPELEARYGADDDRGLASFAAAFVAMQSDLTTIVTVRTGGFDTHSNELANQLPRQQKIAKTLATLVADLRATPDPRDPGRSLADTTTIVLCSEFVRTPKFNDAAGTDHQNTASAIVMGPGVRDGAVVGATDAEGRALGWDGAKAVPQTPETLIDGATLVATALHQFGMSAEADAISERRLGGLFA